MKRRSCVLLPRCNDTQIQKNLVCGHVNSKFRLQESDDEIPPTCKSRRNPRMLALRTPSRSLLDCPLNWCMCRYPYAQNPRAGTGRLVRVLAFLTEDDTGTVRYSAVPILAKCHYWNIRDSSVCIGMTIRILAFLTEDDTGTGFFD